MLAQIMGCGTSSTSRTGTPDYQRAVNVEILEMKNMQSNAGDMANRVRHKLEAHQLFTKVFDKLRVINAGH
jgi:ribosomal protein S3